MSNQNLKIRIKIRQPHPHAIEETYPDPEISYQQTWDWNKIVIAAILLLSMLWITGSFFFSDEHKTTAQIPQPIDFLSSIPDAAPEIATKSNEQTAAAQPIDTKQSPTVATTAPAKPIIIPARKPIVQSTVNRRSLTNGEIPKTAVQAKPHLPSDSPYVLRAQLSRGVKAHEPVDSIESVSLQYGESTPVYFYMHLRNLRGKNIRIDWYHNNKLDSHLLLHVHKDNWRTQASKQLDHRRLGAWRVELLDEAGNRLATRHFTVTRN